MSARYAIHRILAAVLVAGLALVADRAAAQTWTEIGDAGDLVSTAQGTVGSGSLTTIAGSLSSPTDVDVYCIKAGPTVRIPGIPVVSLQCVVIQGPNVWVFDPNALGISTNETCQAGVKQLTNNTIPAVVSQGTYYVAVSYYGMNPFSAGGSIWQSAIPGERAPDGPGAAGALMGWSGVPNVQPQNPYQITLAWSSFCEAPVAVEKSTWGSLKVLYN